MSSGGCPLGYDRKSASAAEKHEAEVVRRVDGVLFDAVEREAARQMDICRTRVAVAPKFVRGLWALGLSHELLPCGREPLRTRSARVSAGGSAICNGARRCCNTLQ